MLCTAAAGTAAMADDSDSDEDVPLSQRCTTLMLPPPAPAPLDETVCLTASVAPADKRPADKRNPDRRPRGRPPAGKRWDATLGWADPIGQCEKNPDCMRGFQPRGFGGKGGAKAATAIELRCPCETRVFKNSAKPAEKDRRAA